ncbi:MAG: glucose-6-phosphate isomerase, partial [Actinomycetota bacterium]
KILGSLVALYEHIVFVQGILWGINSFDQWGVELGKEVANSISPYLTNSDEVSKFDQATQAAILDYRNKR